MTDPGNVWRRWIGVLPRLCAEHTSLSASLPSLPYVSRMARCLEEFG
jgi:hypothetical protein